MGCHLCSDRKDHVKIVIGGLSKSGKTVIFFKLTDHPQLTQPVPTVGYNSQIITLRNKSIIITDIGTREPSRASMSLYLAYAKGFVFVIDTSEKSHLQKSSLKFNQYLKAKQLAKLPILIYLNNRDNAFITEADVTAAFALTERSLKFKVQNCNAVSGEGVSEGFDWLIDRILQKN